jgi:acyl carrier protein
MDKAPGPESVPIGKPLQNLNIYIVDKNMKLCPPGIKGEICVSGVGVGRGYLDDVEKTRGVFTKDPFIELKGTRLYKTGDMGRWLPEGTIEFFGRKDHQVKIRGFRIELGEIENKLLCHRDIKEAVVAVKEDTSGNKYLCAYLVPGGNLDIQGIKEYLLERLPDYMIPTYFVPLDKIPLTPNGKVNRKALPSPGSGEPGDEHIAPRDKIEEKLAEIWSKVLEIAKGSISTNANFFELGGHSLRATVMVARVHKELGVKFPLAQVFKNPTIRKMSECIKELAEEKYTSIEPLEEKEYYPLSSAQKRLYVTYIMGKESEHYNSPMIVELEGKIEPDRFHRTVKRLISRHESLRTSFLMVENEPVQRIHQGVNFEIEYSDINGSAAAGEPEEKIVKNFVRPFDLSQIPLMRVGLIKKDESKYILMLDMHHIITDGVSDGILIKDFMVLYDGKDLPPLKIQYKDFSRWQNWWFEPGKINGQEDYWLNRFKHDVPVLDLPLDFPRHPLRNYDEGDVINFQVDKILTKRLYELVSKMNVSLYMVLLAVFNVLLSKYTGQEDIVVGSPIAGRRHSDLENIIGMFINMLAMRNQPQENKTFKDFLKEVKENALDAYENQDYQYEKLVNKLGLQGVSDRNPLFDVVFAVVNVDDPALDIPGIKLKPYRYKSRTSKFDLRLGVSEGNDVIMMSLTYSTVLFKRTTAEKMAERFVEILEQVLKNSNIKLSEITISHDLLMIESGTLHDYREAFDF